MKSILLLVVMLGLSAAAFGQAEPAPEFGEVAELAAMNKVYVYCEDLKIRQKMVDELRKEPSLEIVGRIDDAEFMVSYTYRWVTWSRNRGIFGTSNKTTKFDGDVVVTVAGTVNDKNQVAQRIVWSVSKDRQGKLGKNPYEKGVRAFLEDYRRVRKAPQP